MSTTQPASSRLIIPAPPAARRDTGIDWYEVLPPGEDLSSLKSSDTRKLVSTMTSEIDSNTVRGVISLEGRSDEVKIEVTMEAKDSSNHSVHVVINDHSFVISGNPKDRSSIKADRSIDLAPEEAEMIKHFSHLSDSLTVLAQATRNSWSCQACCLLGGGVVVAAGCCSMGQLGCCAGALTAGGTFVQNCQDVCPPANPQGIGGMAGVPVLLSE